MSAAPRVEILKDGRFKISWPDGVRWRWVKVFPASVSAALEALRQNRDTWEKY